MFTSTSKSISAGVIIGVVAFISLLLVLPYHLTQLSNNNSTNLSPVLFVDESFNANLQSVTQLSSDEWQKIDNFNFGLKSTPHWLRFNLPQKSTDTHRLLVINYGLLDHVDVWFLSPPEHGSEVLGAYATGDAVPYDERLSKSENFVFQVPDVAHEQIVYIRASSKGALKIPIEIWSNNVFIEYSSLQKLFLGLFFGYMIAMCLSNLFAYASTRNLVFLNYAGYVTSIAMAVASLHAIGFHYIWPNSVWFQEYSVPIFASLTMIFVISLSISLLDLKKQSESIYKTLRNIRYAFVVLFLACFIAPYEVVLKSVLVLLVVTTPIILIAGVVLAFRKNVVARYFCGAWAVLLSSGVSISMENFGLYQSPIDSSYLLMVGAIAEAQLLALALAVNFSQQLQKAKETRDIALMNEKEAIKAKDDLIALQEQNKLDLEYSIEERTLELEIALRELADKNRELEKLSAIDPLTGLMNRRYFDKRILAESRRSKREMTSLGLAMLDIDHFKKINDTYGHLCGDHCLKVFASILKETIKRPSDTICRYGGEEFVLILPNTDEQGLQKLLEKVRKSVEAKKIMFEGQELQMTVSIGGCARTILSEEEHELLIAFVDKQLYAAKENGRNQVLIETY